MGKFLTLWKLDTSKLPEKCEDQISQGVKLLEMVKKDFEMKEGAHMLDWGLFAGTNSGYSVCEGTEQDIDFALLKYSPFLKTKVFPILSVDQVLENKKKLLQI